MHRKRKPYKQPPHLAPSTFSLAHNNSCSIRVMWKKWTANSIIGGWRSRQATLRATVTNKNHAGRHQRYLASSHGSCEFYPNSLTQTSWIEGISWAEEIDLCNHIRICYSIDSPASTLLQLETGSPCRSSGCLSAELGQCEGLCQPPLVPDRMSPQPSTSAGSLGNFGHYQSGKANFGIPVLLAKLADHPKLIPLRTLSYRREDARKQQR